LIDEQGEAVLSDFGFTRIPHELTRTGTRSAGGGTLRYLAPEVCSGEVPRANVATDIYSLALTIWELAASELPFAHLNGFLVLARVLKGERPPMPTMIGTFDNQSEAGKAIWDLLVQMWSQYPKYRPPIGFIKEEIDVID
jgi:serine/threonine protein kinase